MYNIARILVSLSVIIHYYNCISSVKMEVSVSENYMTLSCLIENRNPRKNIYLLCPLVSELNCLENCMAPCQGEECRLIDLIKCREKGFTSRTKMYRIDYVIDSTIHANSGQWKCQYGGESSAAVTVNASSKSVVPVTFLTTTKEPPDTVAKSKTEVKQMSNSKKSASSKVEVVESPLQYDKLITKAEFIFTVVALLTISLIFNIFFCCRMVTSHCCSKKGSKDTNRYLSSNHNNPPFIHSNSQASENERIYEDTSFHHRQMSFLSQIKNGNGNYLASSTLSPSGFSTLQPHTIYNRSFSIPNSVGENGSQQMSYPFLSDPSQSTYTTVTFPTENNYSNFVSVPPEMCLQDGNTIPQPLYLSFQSPHVLFTAGTKYYGNQPLQSVATMSKDYLPAMTTKPEPSTSTQSQSSGTESTVDQSKSNYQLSREMMEEADNLLRTADTLLKSTENEIQYYEQ